MDIDNNPVLCEELIKDFGERMRAIFKKQATDKDFLNIEKFESCKAQAEEAYKLATESGIKTLALGSAIHYEGGKHQMDTAEEQVSLMEDMTGDEIEKSTSGLWSD